MNTTKVLSLFLLMSFLIFPILQCEGQTANLKITHEQHNWDELVVVKDMNPSNWDSTSNAITIGVTGFLKHVEDDQWRYYLTINITNSGQTNITLSNIRQEVLNVTYVDESFEEWNISGNLTINQVLGSHSSVLSDWTMTESGFPKEPKIVWSKLDVFLLGIENPLTLIFAIPEFPSFLIVLLFMMATLPVVIICRRKQFTTGRR